MAGAVAVEHNSFWNGEELTYGVTDSGSRVMIVDQERHDVLLPHAEGIRAGGLDLEFIVARASGDLSERAVHWADVNGGTDVPDLPEEVCGHESRSAMVYTSGTTAFPKGVVHTQRNVVTNLLNMLSMTIALGMTETAAAGGDPAAAAAGDDDSGGPVMLVAVPLFHVTGSHCVMMPITAAKGTLVLMRKWDAGLALELIEREKITNFTGVPTMTMDILAHPDFESTDTTTLVSLGSGGAPNPPHMVEKVTSTTENASPTQGYGLSEVSGIATANGGKMYLSKPGSCGLKAPVTEMKVIDEDGNALPAGERGELCIYGPNVFAEYHNKPEATAEAIDPEGWFHTGDVAIIDEEGYVFIVDRAKDVVIRGGENIGSAEVEAAIAQHPLVHECAVFGVPNERLGEEVGVAIYPLAGETVDPKDIQTFAGERLASFKVPAHVFMYDEPLPKNANGKILKRQLRDDAAS
jgi:acyl-CoA synthetase (AMP-forming)/AMP-acid ligase II